MARSVRTRAGDVAGYAVAVALLVGGGALFTRAILTFNRGPAVAVAAIVLVGWGVDRLLARMRAPRDAEAGPGEDAGPREDAAPPMEPAPAVGEGADRGGSPGAGEYGTGDER